MKWIEKYAEVSFKGFEKVVFLLTFPCLMLMLPFWIVGKFSKKKTND